MSSLLLKLLRARGIVADPVVPFASAQLVASMRANNPGKEVMRVPGDVRPGPYWLVSADDARRMEAGGYPRA